MFCGLAIAAMFWWIFDNYSSSQNATAISVFDNLEREMDSFIADIDSYVEILYSNTRLLNDFTYYFGNTAEGYLTQRINFSPDSSTSFIKDCKSFVARNNYGISEIYFYDYLTINKMKFHSNGRTEYEFKTYMDLTFNNSIEFDGKYVYKKELLNPNNLTQKMGEMYFIIDIERVFSANKNYNINNACVVNGNSYYYLNTEDYLKNYFKTINSKNNGSGTIKLDFFNTIYFNVFESEKYNFELITMIDSLTVLKDNITAYVLMLLLILFLLVSMVAIIAFRMNYDAKYIKRIIRFIDNVRNGDFEQEKIQHRNDEYSMIADSLNDMSDEINKHIQIEYLLKLNQQKAEMVALENQINPHFLYNTLEIIRSKALQGGNKVVGDAIYNLGSMYRDIVKSGHVITIDEELKMLSKYLNLMEFKYEDNLYCQIEVEPSIRKLNTMKFWMQPIVENFFSHGFDKDNEYNLLLIIGNETKEEYIIEFVNNGSGIEEEEIKELNARLFETDQKMDSKINIESQNLKNIGLKNVFLRLRYFYGKCLSMTIFNNKEAGITVRVTIKKESLNVQLIDS